MAKMTKEGVQLILGFEGFESHPYWPGGASGVTIGYGYDLGYHEQRELFDDWIDDGKVTCPGGGMEVQALLECCGKTGETARGMLQIVRDCRVLEIDARIVFEQRSLPKYEAATRRAYPGVDDLPDPVYSALVSLVFNRGTDMGRPGTDSWDRRKEMRDLRIAVKDKNVRDIAQLILEMKRLWADGPRGLLRRRDAEAAMIESALA